MASAPRNEHNIRRDEILAYHREFIAAHVGNRPEFLVRDLADDYVNVSRGRLLRQSKEEIRRAFVDYLGTTTFERYELLEEPAIGFSDDLSVAWSVFRLHVVGTRHRTGGEDLSYDTTWGCLVVFHRRAGRWEVAAEASNLADD